MVVRIAHYGVCVEKHGTHYAWNSLLLYICTLFQPLYTYDQLFVLHCTAAWRHPGISRVLVGGLESKALPVNNYCYIRTSGRHPNNQTHRVTYGGSDRMFGILMRHMFFAPTISWEVLLRCITLFCTNGINDTHWC